jgi:hypothetical protein
VQFGRATSWPARTLTDCRHGIDQRLQELAVVPVRRRDFQGEGDAIGIDANRLPKAGSSKFCVDDRSVFHLLMFASGVTEDASAQ